MNQTLKCVLKNLAPAALGFITVSIIFYIFTILPALNIPDDAVLNQSLMTPVQETGFGYGLAPIGLLVLVFLFILGLWSLASLLKPCFIKVKDETNK